MVKIDLITGFLGSGKTTFIRKYVQQLLERGEKICILENDYGAINVDMMLLKDMRGENCELEMVSGGCDLDCHKRRFKTKLISMGMSGYSRVIVEPSGIFDVDEFFDTLYEEPLDNWYELGNVIAIVDATSIGKFTELSRHILATQVASAGCIVFSHMDEVKTENIAEAITYINNACSEIKANRTFEAGRDICTTDYSLLSAAQWDKLIKCGVKHTSFAKLFNMDNIDFSSLFFMDTGLDKDSVKILSKQLFEDKKYGDIHRIKGFTREKNGDFMQINVTRDSYTAKPIEDGQNVIIVIGEGLNSNLITDLINSYA